tara:strand:+ start:1557 stop:1946 length:390 start_codon:yes stop_codon:yes gene_type:complete
MKNKYVKKSSDRSFGIVFFIFFCLVACYPLLKGDNIRLWSLIIAFIFLFLGIINSRLLAPINKIWFKFGLFLGKIISPIVMFLIFFIVVTPIAILMRLLKKDLLNIKLNNDESYWIKKTGPKSKMKNQF